MRFLVLVAACAGARRLDIAGDASQGACYNADGTYGVTCNVAEADCTGSYLAPGSIYGGCCLCEAGCDHSAETSTDCSYYDCLLYTSPSPRDRG